MSIGLSTDVRRFIDEQIDSLEHLELLLSLAREPGIRHGAAEISAKVGLSSASTQRRLDELRDRGLLNQSAEGYSFIATPQVGAIVAEVARAYQEQRLEVLHRVSERTLKRLRTFADAFRLRREGDG